MSRMFRCRWHENMDVASIWISKMLCGVRAMLVASRLTDRWQKWIMFEFCLRKKKTPFFFRKHSMVHFWPQKNASSVHTTHLCLLLNIIIHYRPIVCLSIVIIDPKNHSPRTQSFVFGTKTLHLFNLINVLWSQPFISIIEPYKFNEYMSPSWQFWQLQKNYQMLIKMTLFHHTHHPLDFE